MDQLGVNAAVTFTVLFLAQVYASPTFYWSQPECYQQSSDGFSNSYDSYQGPSYEETVRAMVEETLRAVRDIIQITVKATKQELAVISQAFYNNLPNDCNSVSDSESDDDTGGYEFNDTPVEIVEPPGQSIDNGYVYPVPQHNSTVDMGSPTSTTSEKIPNDSEKPISSLSDVLASTLSPVESPLRPLGDNKTTTEQTNSDKESITQPNSTHVNRTDTSCFSPSSGLSQQSSPSTESGESETSSSLPEVVWNEPSPIFNWNTTSSALLAASEDDSEPTFLNLTTTEINTSLIPSDIHPTLSQLNTSGSGMKSSSLDPTNVEFTTAFTTTTTHTTTTAYTTIATNVPGVSSLMSQSADELSAVIVMTLLPDLTTEQPTSTSTSEGEQQSSDLTTLEVTTKPARKSKL